MYEERTFEWCMKRALARVPDTVSKRPGDIVYDMLSPVCWEMAELYFALSIMQELVFLGTAKGEYLDAWGMQTGGLVRLPATHSRYAFAYEGAEPPEGTRFFAEMQYFVLLRDEETGELILESEATGRETTAILPGTPAIPAVTVRGLKRAAFGVLLSAGVDTEDDEHFRQRIREKLTGPAANGNIQHYKTWAESVPGVGRAKVIPLFAGENTVMVVLFDPDGRPVMQDVVDAVQEYIDPITKDLTVEVDGITYPSGDGNGCGAANIGAHLTTVSATPIEIRVEFTAVIEPGWSMHTAKQQAKEAIDGYFRSLALTNLDAASIAMDAIGTVVRVSAVGAALSACPALADYDRLLLNGSARNIEIGQTSAPVLTEVIANAPV